MLIDHPARQGETASLLDWLRFNLSQWMQRKANDMEHRALYPEDRRCPECGSWTSPRFDFHCDHIPF